MSPETIARWQFGITTVYHFLFVPLTIALSVLTAVMQSIWVKSGNEAWLRLTKFIGKLFLINFAMGVVTGIVQEFQFGMNWSEYSRFVGDIFGAPLALEALIAFFLESTFLGMWIFGWDRLKKGVHLATIWLAAIGTFISSIFIIAANSWMQNPVGATYDPDRGRAALTSLGDVLMNPVFLTQWPHTIAASFVTGGAFIAAVAAYRLVKTNNETPDKTSDLATYKKGVKLGAWVLIVAGVCTVFSGDMLGKEMVQTQPTKMAAAENIQEEFPDGKAPFQIVPGLDLFPGMLNWLYGTEHIQSIPDLEQQYEDQGFLQFDSDKGTPVEGTELQQEFADELSQIDGVSDEIIPSTLVSFWGFRLMIGIGLLAVVGGIWLLIVTRKDKIPNPNRLFTAAVVVLPLLPLLANSFGWLFTEMGRQPWIVNGVLPTAVAVSPTVSVGATWFSMVLYTLVYGVLAVVEVRLLLKFIRIGLPEDVVVSTKDEGEPLSFAY